ncbi:hypothetical protein GCK32_013526 [Trichostrongylus colubriformis]|uniref:Uncharacterized protein n=1 Tax=Trichostrongylus colubriformis TaxID=6319 RepID=A0AAN8ISX8_TRICO
MVYLKEPQFILDVERRRSFTRQYCFKNLEKDE